MDPSTRLNRTSVGLKQQYGSKYFLTMSGLNRTSVGLKQVAVDQEDKGREGPQSNQRGIET